MSESTSPPATAGRRGRGILPGTLAAVLLLMGALLSFPAQPAQAQTPLPPLPSSEPLTDGHVLVGLARLANGIGQGEVRQYSSTGTHIGSLLTNSGSIEETGMCFDAGGKLYTTNFDARSMSKFGPTSGVPDAGFAGSYIGLGDRTGGTRGAPSSCVVDASQNLYVGNTLGVGRFDGGGELLKLDLSGNPVSLPFLPDEGMSVEGYDAGGNEILGPGRGAAWIDLLPDQRTMLYVSLGFNIKRFDVETGQQLPSDLCPDAGCVNGNGGRVNGPLRSLRILPAIHNSNPLDPDGRDVLVADDDNFSGDGAVRRYDSAGNYVRSYVVQNLLSGPWGVPQFFPWVVALDPDPLYFWVGDGYTGEVFRIAVGSATETTTTVERQFLAGGCAPPAVDYSDYYCPVSGGLAVVGEPRAATSAKPNASVTPDAASKTYGAPDPAFIGTLSGFDVADNVSATYTRTAGETVADSPYTISATLSPGSVLGNYNITYKTAPFTIIPATPTVTVTGGTFAYDGTAHPATVTVTGVGGGPVLGSTTLNYAGVLPTSYGPSTTAPSNAGAYQASAVFTSGDPNYNNAVGTGSITIDKANASVTPNAASKIEGAADPALTGTLSGFLPADNVTATYTRTAGETVAGSPYTISATLSPAGVLGNYAITSNTAAFTIISATPGISLTKTPDKATAAFGESVTYTYVVTNTGNVTLTNVSVVDDNATPTYAADDFPVGTVASLAPSASATLIRTVVPPARLCKPDSGQSCGSLVTQHRDDGTTKFTYLQSRDDREGHADSSGWSGGRSYSSKARFRVDGLDGLSSYLADGAPGSGDSSKHANSFSLVVNRSLVTKSDGSVKPPAIYHKKGWNGDWRRDWDSAHGWSDRSRKWDDDHEGYNNDDDYDMNTHPQLCPAPSTNTATVTATAGSATVTATASATVQLVAPPTPSISMSKTADKQSVVFGESITYTYVVTNTGTVTLTNVKVVDDNGTPHYAADDFTMGPVAELTPGASAPFTRTLVPPAKMCSTDSSGKTRSCGTFLTEHRDDGTTKFTYLQSRDRRDSYQGGGGWSGSRAYAHKTKFRVIDRYGISSHDLDGTLGTGDDSTHANLFSVVVTTSDVASADGTVMPPKLYQKKGWNGNWREDWDSNHGWSDRSHNWDDDRPSHDNDSDYDYDSNPEQCPTSATNVARVTATAGGVTVSATDKETVQIIGPPPHAPYTTHTQSGWGAKPSGSNAGKRLAERFAQVYPSGAVIGGTKTIKLTSAAAVEAFLPQAGTPAKLTQDYINPTSPISTLAGQVLALRLNVDFSAAGLTTMGFATLTVVEGELAGMTVNDVLALGNSVLGGGALPSGLKLSELAKIIGLINSNFEGGTQDDDYLQ